MDAGISSTEHVLFCWRDGIDPLQLGRQLDFNTPGREDSRKLNVLTIWYAMLALSHAETSLREQQSEFRVTVFIQ